MKAIIMAGGEGSRLRPLTCDCPKPMMRLMDRPVMQYALELLRAHGIREIAATLGYLPDAIMDYFSDGSAFDVRLRYYVEETPLGTAGGVRRAADFLNETFIVLSGDGITDLDITAAVRFHRERGALVTLVLRREENPMEYGVVATDADGRVRGFYEKPPRCDIVSDTINTGIYILEPEALLRIPEDRAYDFGHDLFPRLVEAGERVYGYVTEDYWCDIGDVRAYLEAHRAAMDGRIHLSGLGGGAVVLPGAQVDSTAKLDAPCRIGPGARIGANAHIGAYSVIGENAFVGENADLKRCVLWPGARAEAFSQARGAIFATGAALLRHAQAYEESVLGTDARVGERASVLPGIRIWPGKTVADGEKLDTNRVWGNRASDGFSAGAIPIATPDQAARAAQACAAVLAPKELLLGRGESPVASAMWHAAAAGAMAQGMAVADTGCCTLPLLRYAQKLLHAQAAALVEADRLIPLNDRGATLPARQQRSIDAMRARHDYAPPFSAPTHSMRTEAPVESMYIADVAACFRANPERAPGIALHAENGRIRDLAQRAFERAGLKVETCEEKGEPRTNGIAPGSARHEFERAGGIASGTAQREIERVNGIVSAEPPLGVLMDASGEGAELIGEQGLFSKTELQLMRAWIALERGERELFLPVWATRAISRLAEQYGARTTFVAGERAVWLNLLAERSPGQFELWTDGIRFAICAASALTECGEAAWRSAMPRVEQAHGSVSVAREKTGCVLRAFAENEENAETGGGVRFTRGDGWAWVCPDEARAEFQIVTEAASAEIAAELCDFCRETLEKLNREE